MYGFKSPKEQALFHAQRTMSKILDGGSKTSTILRGCMVVASLLGDHENKKWISNELSGYYEENNQIPNYRRFIKSADKKFKFQVGHSMHKLEHILESGKLLDIWSEKHKEVVEMDPSWCHSICQSVQDKCLKFLTDTSTKIEYSGMVTSLIDTIQKEVDDALTKINPEIISELQSIYINLSGKTPAEWSKAAHSCRRVLKLLADQVFSPREEPYKDSEGKVHSVKEDDYMNRLLVFAEENKGNKLVRTETKVLATYFDSLRELSGKGEHSKELKKFEAEQIVIHTYLVVSEIVKLMRANNSK